MPYKRKSYTPRKYDGYRRSHHTYRASVKKPYGGSRYGNDAFVKVEAIEQLSVTAGALAGQVFSTMRQD